MPTPKELLDAGQLDGAIQALTQEVKANPSDVPRRTFLFELLCFAGEWDRAEKQIDVIGQQSVPAALAAQVYRANVAAERQRARLFEEGVAPHFLTEPPRHVDLQVEGIRRLAESDADSARKLFDQAEEERPALGGTWNGQPFADLRDYDDALGGVLELIVKDKYAWIPFQQIRRLEVRRPEKLRDLLWIPSRVEALDGTIGEVFVPVLYAGSSRQKDDLLRLGRRTEWKAVTEELTVGLGQRLLLVDETDQPILEARTVEFDGVPATAGAS
ncbi:MAG: type VI secretion system accessory protein TagJ [Thermoanaerobaculia bacterium]